MKFLQLFITLNIAKINFTDEKKMNYFEIIELHIDTI